MVLRSSLATRQAGSGRRPLVYVTELTVSPATADELERRLADLKSWLDRAADDPGDVLLGFFTDERR